MLNAEFLSTLTPVEIEMVHNFIGALYRNNITEDAKNYDNLKDSVTECPYCGYKHIVRNGHNKQTSRQRYLCRNSACGRTFETTTSTFFSHSKTNYQTWVTFIGCETVGLSLRDESQICGISVTGCFNMRHKLYDSLRDYQESQKMEGLCEVDAAYTKINLKGWQKDEMPRISKKRGKHKSDCEHKNLAGISHHKICLISSIDEKDHILFKIEGLGPETLEKYNKYQDHFSKNCMIVCDAKLCIRQFAEEHKMKADVIPSGGFKSPLGNALGTINQFHQSFNELLRKKHGVGTRHLQGYMDWLVFIKQMRYRLENRKLSTQIYMDIIRTNSSCTTDEICNEPLPISLEEAYSEYGFFSKKPHQLVS
jgi:transposase-like protein